jgi:mRNA-degrading endonuclease RelE of RelBE toxin-antitoxin system
VTEHEPEAPYRLITASSAARAISEQLPERIALAAIDFITGPLLQNPQRVGTALHGPLEGLHGARLGRNYRVEYGINDENHTVEVVRIARRADIYGIT